MKKKILALLATSLAFAGSAQAWQPTKPIEVVIGFAPGSGNEIVFRALATEVEKNTGAKFVVITKPGAGGTIATKQLLTEKPDGHTVVMAIGEGIPVQDKISVPDPAVLGYTVNDFTYIIAPAVNQYAVIANGADPINSTRDLVQALGKDKMSFGAGGGARLPYEVLKQRTPFGDIVRVQHQGPVPVVTDIAGGHIRLAIIPSTVANRFTGDGKVKIVALTGNKRLAQIANVPALGETFPGYNVITTWGLIGPKGMPADVVEWYVREFNRALKSDSVKKFWELNLLEVNDKLLTSAGFTEYVRQTEKQYSNVVTTVNQETVK